MLFLRQDTMNDIIRHKPDGGLVRARSLLGVRPQHDKDDKTTYSQQLIGTEPYNFSHTEEIYFADTVCKKKQ